MKYRTVDLCAGIGGIRRGFELTGHFENVLSSEIDKYACKTYEHLFGDNPKNDLTSEDFKSLMENTEYDVLLAGFPCQTFSRAGLGMGFQDQTKGTIFYHISEIIKRTRPKAVFLENVDNLVRHDGGKTIELILETLDLELDYKIVGVEKDENNNLIYRPESFVRNSRYFGVPQNRPRTYIAGFDRGYYGKNITDQFHEHLPEQNDLRLYEDLNELLEYGANERFYLSQGYMDTLVRHKARQKRRGNGFGYMVVNRNNGRVPVANTIMAVGGSGKERNLVYDPQPGIAGKTVAGKQSPLNDMQLRNMTPREWGKLQGFIGYAFMKNGEDEFSFPEGISNTQKYKQFGNSVTIPAIETFAHFIYKTILHFKNVSI